MGRGTLRQVPTGSIEVRSIRLPRDSLRRQHRRIALDVDCRNIQQVHSCFSSILGNLEGCIGLPNVISARLRVRDQHCASATCTQPRVGRADSCGYSKTFSPSSPSPLRTWLARGLRLLDTLYNELQCLIFSWLWAQTCSHSLNRTTSLCSPTHNTSIDRTTCLGERVLSRDFRLGVPYA